MIDEPFIKEVACWKQHYGLRQVGVTTDEKPVIYGLDVYKYVSSQGIDLDTMLSVLDKRGALVDWVGFAKAATVEGWLIDTILRKVGYAVTEVHGARYWAEVEQRIKLWFIELYK